MKPFDLPFSTILSVSLPLPFRFLFAIGVSFFPLLAPRVAEKRSFYLASAAGYGSPLDRSEGRCHPIALSSGSPPPSCPRDCPLFLFFLPVLPVTCERVLAGFIALVGRKPQSGSSLFR